MNHKRKLYLLLIVILVFVLTLFTFSGCGPVQMDITVSGAFTPPVLTGGAGYENSRSNSLNRALEETVAPEYVYLNDSLSDQWIADYPGWTLVPKVATYFNNLVVDTQATLQEESISLTESENPAYTWTGSFPGYGEGEFWVSEDGKKWERSYDEGVDGYEAFAKFEETENYRRLMRIMFMKGGDDNEMIELYETSKYKYVKILWWSKHSDSADSPPKLTHFVSVMEKTSGKEKTTGRSLSENLDADDLTTHTFTDSPGTVADTDYYAHTDTSDPYWSGIDVYGYFNATDFAVTPEEDAYSTGNYDDYPDPNLVTNLFDDGLTETMWSDLKTKVNNGESIAFVDWDLSDFED